MSKQQIKRAPIVITCPGEVIGFENRVQYIMYSKITCMANTKNADLSADFHSSSVNSIKSHDFLCRALKAIE
jgi:beta-galactosidase/beta-glucuronidase